MNDCGTVCSPQRDLVVESSLQTLVGLGDGGVSDADPSQQGKWEPECMSTILFVLGTPAPRCGGLNKMMGLSLGPPN